MSKQFAVFADITPGRATIVAVGDAITVWTVAQEVGGRHGFCLSVDRHGDPVEEGDRVYLSAIEEISADEVSSYVW